MKKKRFAKVNIEISNICNLQCSFCPEVIRTKKLMDLELFERIIIQVTPLTELVCFHLMGDPLTHPKLAEMVKICEKYGAKIFFVTNGVLLKATSEQLLLSSAFHQINFSLHSFSDNFKGKDPTAYLQKIFKWTELAFLDRPDLFINYRLWNLQDVRGADSENADMLAAIENHFNFNFSRNIDVRQQKSVHVKNKLYLHFDTEFIWPAIDLPVLGQHGTCYGLNSHFGILADGTIVPCCLDKEAAIALGNVGDNSIIDILDGPRAKNMLRGFSENKLIEDLCQRCQYIERFQT